MAETAALRADCTRRKIGAVLMLPDHSVVMAGYNGGPPKGASCLKGECPRGTKSHAELAADSVYDSGGGTCIALHAEWNIFLRASWTQLQGSTLYISDEPCHICRVMIAGSGLAQVVYRKTTKTPWGTSVTTCAWDVTKDSVAVEEPEEDSIDGTVWVYDPKLGPTPQRVFGAGGTIHPELWAYHHGAVNYPRSIYFFAGPDMEPL